MPRALAASSRWAFEALPPPDRGFHTTTGRFGGGAVGSGTCTRNAERAAAVARANNTIAATASARTPPATRATTAATSSTPAATVSTRREVPCRHMASHPVATAATKRSSTISPRGKLREALHTRTPNEAATSSSARTESRRCDFIVRSIQLRGTRVLLRFSELKFCVPPACTRNLSSVGVGPMLPWCHVRLVTRVGERWTRCATVADVKHSRIHCTGANGVRLVADAYGDPDDTRGAAAARRRADPPLVGWHRRGAGRRAASTR